MYKKIGSLSLVKNTQGEWTPRNVLCRIGVGSMMLLALCLVMQLCDGAISLSCIDAQHRTHQEAVVGERYSIEVKLQGPAGKKGAWPHVSGLSADCVVGRQQRQEVSWIQGKPSESTYFVWDVVFNNPGTITLDAVYYTDEGKKFETPSFSMVVHARALDAQSSNHKSSAHSIFFRWEVERLDVFVGEVVPVSLVFYTTDSTVQLESISEITVQDAHILLRPEPVWGSAMHNGLVYKTATWKGFVCAQKTGVINLPIVSLSYAVSSNTGGSSHWAMMQRMFSSFAPLHVKRSPALSLQVRPLPVTDVPVIGVGVIHEAVRGCNRLEIPCGEAGSLVYRLKGTIHPACLRLPDPIISDTTTKLYSSPAKHTGDFPNYTYEQEFVMHPGKAGVIHLEEQNLWFFNPHNERYEKISLEEHDITVIENISLVPHAAVSPADENNNEASVATVVQDLPQAHSLATLSAWLVWASCPLLPLSLFLLLLLLPCIVVLSRGWLGPLLYRAHRTVKLRWLLRRSLRNIDAAISARDGYVVLNVMKNFVQQLYNVPHHVVEGSYIADDLLRRGVPLQRVAEWQALWAELQRCAFGNVGFTQEWEKLGARCHEWIKILAGLQRQGRI